MDENLYLLMILQFFSALIFYMSFNYGINERLREKHSKTFINKTNAHERLWRRFFYLQWRRYLPSHCFVAAFGSSVIMLLSAIISCVYGIRYMMSAPLYSCDVWLANAVVVFIFLFWGIRIIMRIFDRIFGK